MCMAWSHVRTFETKKKQFFFLSLRKTDNISLCGPFELHLLIGFRVRFAVFFSFFFLEYVLRNVKINLLDDGLKTPCTKSY